MSCLEALTLFWHWAFGCYTIYMTHKVLPRVWNKCMHNFENLLERFREKSAWNVALKYAWKKEGGKFEFKATLKSTKSMLCVCSLFSSLVDKGMCAHDIDCLNSSSLFEVYAPDFGPHVITQKSPEQKKSDRGTRRGGSMPRHAGKSRGHFDHKIRESLNSMDYF